MKKLYIAVTLILIYTSAFAQLGEIPPGNYVNLDQLMEAIAGLPVTVVEDETNPPPANGPPNAVSDNFGTEWEGKSVLDNDSDPDGDPMTAEMAEQSTTGTVQLSPDGTFLYSPSSSAEQTEFKYRAVDNHGNKSIDVSVRFKPGGPVEPPVPGETLLVLCTGMSNARQECDAWRKNNQTQYEIVNVTWSGHDYWRLRKPGESEVYWARAADLLSRRGLTFADVDIVYNKNTLSYQQSPPGHPDGEDFAAEAEYWEESMVWFHGEVLKYIPHLQAGYHGVRSSGEWCTKSPQGLADYSKSAIEGAVQNDPLWSLGPDLSTPNYVRADYQADGCHPSASGLSKMTPIINGFFKSLEDREPVDPCEGADPPEDCGTEPPIGQIPPVEYMPDFGNLGTGEVPYPDGVCEAINEEEGIVSTVRSWFGEAELKAGPKVILQDNELLITAIDRLAGGPGILEIPYDVDTVMCDSLWLRDNKVKGSITVSGTIGPNGEIPRFYCRSDTRDGTIPREAMTGQFLTIVGNYSEKGIEFLIENIHVDGYKKAVVGPTTGKVILRHNYLHHGLSDGISNSNNYSGENGMTWEVCNNEISHFGQGNTIHNLYVHRTPGGAGNNPELDGSSGWSTLWFVDNLCHSSPFSHCLKSTSNENNVLGNRFYNGLATDPSYTMRYGSTNIDLISVAKNRIEGNYVESTKMESNKLGVQMVGIRNRRTIVRGADLPKMWSKDIPPVKIDGPAHSNEYWDNLNGEILFPTIVKNNTFVAKGDYAANYYAITMYGSYPNHETTLGSPSCWLPTPDSWYERTRVYDLGNTYVNIAQDHRHRSVLIGHSYYSNCPEPYSDPNGPKPPGPGPSDDMIEF